MKLYALSRPMAFFMSNPFGEVLLLPACPFERQFVLRALDLYLAVAYLFGLGRREAFYLVGELQGHAPYDVDVPVVSGQVRPERVLRASGVVVETPVRVFGPVVLYVAYALLQRRRDHILAHVVRVVPVPGIPQQMFGYEPEISADLRRRFPVLLTLLQLFRELL